MEVLRVYDDNKCWDILTFTIDGEVVGEMNVELDNRYAYIHSISSFKQFQGIGTDMVKYLKSLEIKEIEGTADPESIGFWNKFNVVWDDEDFKVYL